MKEIVCFVIGLVVLLGVLSMLREETSRRIRNSRYWFVGWLGYLLGLSFAAKLMMPVLNPLLAGINDDIAVPAIMGGAIFVTTVMFIVNMYRLRRQTRQG